MLFKNKKKHILGEASIYLWKSIRNRCYVFSEDSVWSQVLNMKDSISVEYSKLEDLFSQKEPVSPKNSSTSPAAEGEEKAKRNSQNQEVSKR